MAIIPIKNLGSIGVVTDQPPCDLPLNGISNAVNCMFANGMVSTTLGWRTVPIAGSNFLPANLTWFQSYEFGDNVYTAFFGNNIRVWNGVTLITPTTAPAITASGIWSTDVYGDWVVATNEFDFPIYNSTKDGSVWSVLPGWTAAGAPNADCKAVRSYKSYLFAVGITGKPYDVAWSNLGVLGNFPNNWDSTDPTSFAGTVTLAQSDGPVIDCRPLGDSMIVYTAYAVYAFTATGNVNNPMNVRRLFAGGLCAKDAVSIVQNRHLAVGERYLYAHDGSSVQLVAHGVIEDDFYKMQVKDLLTVRTAHDEEEHRVLIYFRSTDGQTLRDKILAWNWKDNLWYYESPDPSYYNLHCIKDSAAPGVPTTWADLQTAGTLWSDLNATPWSALDGRGARRKVFQLISFVGNTPQFCERNFGSTRDGFPFTSYIERQYLDFDELKNASDTVIDIGVVYPRLRNNMSDGLKYRAVTTESPAQLVNWSQSPVLEMDLTGDAREYIMDWNVCGRYVSYQIGLFSLDLADLTKTYWALSGLDIDGRIEGGR